MLSGDTHTVRPLLVSAEILGQIVVRKSIACKATPAVSRSFVLFGAALSAVGSLSLMGHSGVFHVELVF